MGQARASSVKVRYIGVSTQAVRELLKSFKYGCSDILLVFRRNQPGSRLKKMTPEASIRGLVVPSETGTRKVTSAHQPCEGSSDKACLRDRHYKAPGEGSAIKHHSGESKGLQARGTSQSPHQILGCRIRIQSGRGYMGGNISKKTSQASH